MDGRRPGGPNDAMLALLTERGRSLPSAMACGVGMADPYASGVAVRLARS